MWRQGENNIVETRRASSLLITNILNYNQTIEWLYSRLPVFQRVGKAAYKANLDNTFALDEYFNHPHRKFRSIHIAGTNGKGSVAHILASVLQSAGYKTGLYTSPHLRSFRERIRINGREISKEDVTLFVQENMRFFEKLKPSFFEMTVAMAFDHFAKENTDIAVVETGLGGRLDSTNIITPLVSVITNISYDHTEFLGDTLEKIAWEKANIIKEEIPVIIGETQPEIKHVFEDMAKEKDAQIYFADKIYSAEKNIKDNFIDYSIYKNEKKYLENLETDLIGSYQEKNIITAISAIEVMTQNDLSITKKNICDGVGNVRESTGFSGRWQMLDKNPLTICDVGHNEEGIKSIVDQIKSTSFKKLHFVFGMVNDKDIKKILKHLPVDAEYYFTKAGIPRALDENLLAKEALKFGLKGKIYPTVSDAFIDAKNNADTNDMIFIGGSTFVVAEVLL